MRGDALKGHLDLLVLAIVAPGPVHGYAVIDSLRERSGGLFDLPEGTVYPVLHRLEKAGLLSSEWAIVGGRRRRTYCLTHDGRESLVDMRTGWQRFADAIGSTLKGAPWPATS